MRSYKMPQKPKERSLNPIWRGVGFVIIAVLTLGSYFAVSGGIKLINAANREKVFLPAPFGAQGIPALDLELGTYRFPRPVTQWPVPGYGPFTLDEPMYQIGPVKLEVTSLAITVLVSLIAYGVMSLVWGIVANPTQLGPQDAPPPPRKRRTNLAR
jgi:hypothetical protein